MLTKPTHTLGVIGVRDYNGKVYTNAPYIEATLQEHLRQREITSFQIVTGGGKGVESLVVDFANKAGIAVRSIPPNIQQYGQQKAFFIRNNAVVAESTEVIIFWDGLAPPIPDAIMAAMQMQRRVTVYPIL